MEITGLTFEMLESKGIRENYIRIAKTGGG